MRLCFYYGWFSAIILIPRSTQPGHPSVGSCNEYQH